MEKLCKEYIALLSSDKLPSDRFWELEKRIREDKRATGVVVTNSRSKMIDNILDLLISPYLYLEQHSAVGTVIETAVVISIFAVFLAVSLSACSREVYLVYLDLHGRTLLAVLFIGGTSQFADYGDHFALREHIIDELCIMIPCGAV